MKQDETAESKECQHSGPGASHLGLGGEEFIVSSDAQMKPAV